MMIALVTLAITTACKEEAGRAPRFAPTSTFASSAPTANAEEAAARKKALDAYNGFREAQVTAAATSDPNGGDLAKYTADPLLTQLRSDLALKRSQSLITVGRPAWQAEVTDVNVTRRPFTVGLRDCFDGTNWTIVNKTTRKPAGLPNQNKRYVVSATVVQYDDGRWLVTRAQAERERPC